MLTRERRTSVPVLSWWMESDGTIWDCIYWDTKKTVLVRGGNLWEVPNRGAYSMETLFRPAYEDYVNTEVR